MMADSSPHFNINEEELARRRHARVWMTLTLMLTDLISLALAFWLAFSLRSRPPGGEALQLSSYVNLIPALLLFILFYTVSGLYPTVGVGPVDELRLLSKATSIVFILFMAYTFWSPLPVNLSRLAFLSAWPAALVLTQLDRWLLRIVARYIGFWGEPVVIVGIGPETEYIEAYIRDSVRLGIRPVMTVDGHWTPDERFACVLKKTGIRTAILVVSEMSAAMKAQIIDHRQYPFHRLILIPSLDWVYSLGISTYDLEGILGLGVRQNLLNRWEQFVKRCLDLIIVIVGSFAIAPLWLAIALLIRLDSRGRTLYRQDRVGRDGKHFKIWKFRTMVSNADQVLREHLAAHPALKAEWEATQKLKNDPRVTRVGKILRKLSLDELPQVWNVLLGEMSIVGPRPIVDAEVEHYRHVFNIYKLVRPGITGLWQVSGRSDTGYDRRVRYDEYYIRNWSIWLDVYILLRTIFVVFTQRGAY